MGLVEEKMNARFLVLLTGFVLMVTGFGLVYGEYVGELGLSLLHLAVLSIVGVIGLLILALALREFKRNWYWHEVGKWHGIIGLIIFIIIVIALWHYGILEWLL